MNPVKAKILLHSLVEICDTPLEAMSCVEGCEFLSKKLYKLAKQAKKLLEENEK